MPSADPYDLPGQSLFKWAFALTMFAVGTVIDPKSFVFLARQPVSVLLGLATQFTVMPTLAFLIARFAGFDDEIALGFIVVGCAPGAMTSNVLTYLAKGDTAFSVTLTTFASIIADKRSGARRGARTRRWTSIPSRGETLRRFWLTIWIWNRSLNRPRRVRTRT